MTDTFPKMTTDEKLEYARRLESEIPTQDPVQDKALWSAALALREAARAAQAAS